MPQYIASSRAIRLEDGRTLHPISSILSRRTRALLRSVAKERHAANRVQRANRPHRLG